MDAAELLRRPYPTSLRLWLLRSSPCDQVRHALDFMICMLTKFAFDLASLPMRHIVLGIFVSSTCFGAISTVSDTIACSLATLEPRLPTDYLQPTLLRAISHLHIKRANRNGPYLLQLTDMHASNIFVDEMWNATCLIDLGWVCALPSEMLAVPYWLTGCKLDEIKDDRLEEYDAVRRESVDVVKAEERKMGTSRSLSPSVSMDSMEEMWDTKGVWFWYCVESVNAMYYLVADHLCPQFGESLSSKVEGVLSSFGAKTPKVQFKRR